MCYGENINLRFNILNPVKDKNKPYYSKTKDYFYFPVNKYYRYYIEVSQTNETTGQIDYCILISKTKFNDNCRLCEVVRNGHCKLRPRGEFKNYLIRESIERGNFECNLIDSNADYDTYMII